MTKFPFVSIIIPNYNGENFLIDCLTSVLKTKYGNFEIIIVDDGSKDKSLEIINKFKKKDKRISLIMNEKNMGAAESRNKASLIANGKVLVFLDNDTEVDKNWLSYMIKTLFKRSSTGAVQAKIIDFQNRDILQCAGVKLWAQTGWGLPIGQWQNEKKIVKEESIAGLSAALAVKREVFEETLGFDTKESVVTEDLDLSWRVWLLGKKVLLSPKSKVYHWTKSIEMRSNIGHNKEDIYFHLTKNSITSILKNYEINNAVKFVLSSFYISIGRAALVALRRKELSAFIGTLKGIFWTILNFSYILSQRRKIQIKRKVSDDKLFGEVLIKGSAFDIYNKHFSVTKLY